MSKKSAAANPPAYSTDEGVILLGGSNSFADTGDAIEVTGSNDSVTKAANTTVQFNGGGETVLAAGSGFISLLDAGGSTVIEATVASNAQFTASGSGDSMAKAPDPLSPSVSIGAPLTSGSASHLGILQPAENIVINAVTQVNTYRPHFFLFSSRCEFHGGIAGSKCGALRASIAGNALRPRVFGKVRLPLLLSLFACSLTGCGPAEKFELSQGGSINYLRQPHNLENPGVAYDPWRGEISRDRVFFDFNSSNLQSSERAILDTWIKSLNAHPDFKIMIEGHCDERGTREYNLALGERRAEAVRRYLTAQGIQAARLKTVSYGKERPTALGNNEAALALNRNAVGVME